MAIALYLVSAARTDCVTCRRFWQWQTGMLMFVVGNIANFVARGQLPLLYATQVC